MSPHLCDMDTSYLLSSYKVLSGCRKGVCSNETSKSGPPGMEMSVELDYSSPVCEKGAFNGHKTWTCVKQCYKRYFYNFFKIGQRGLEGG